MKKVPFVTLDKLQEITAQFPTPFHLYDEKGIRENVARNADHAKNARRGVAAEFAERRGVFQNITPRGKEKAPAAPSSKACDGGRTPDAPIRR